MHLDDTSHLGEEWLFGSTRSHDFASMGDWVYLWKVRLDPTTHNPDSSTLICIKIVAGRAFGAGAFITGLKSTLEANGDLHLTYLKHDSDLHYFIIDWTTGDMKKSTEVLQKLSKTDPVRVVFVGNSR